MEQAATAVAVSRTTASRSAIGIVMEALGWLTDIAGLSRAEATDVMRGSARGLLHAALTVGPPARRE